MCILTEEEVKAIREAVVNEFRTNPNLTEEDICKHTVSCSIDNFTMIGDNWVIIKYYNSLEKIYISEEGYHCESITYADAIPNYGEIEFNEQTDL
jgi:hypothetical protein